MSSIKQNDYVPIMKVKQFATLGSSSLFMYSYDNTLYQISNNGFTPKYKYIFSERFQDVPITNDEIKKETQYIGGIDAIYQTNNSIILKYEDKGNIMNAIYNKTTGKCYTYSSVFNNSNFGNLKDFRYFISEGQNIISVFNPELFLDSAHGIYDNSKIKDLSKKKELDNILSKVSFDDNPIIIRYKLKENSKL